MPPVLELKGITKRFPGVLANDHIDLRLEKGEILALLGENGAGKSTLMKQLYGLYKPDGGKILINGEEVVFHSPTDAINAGTNIALSTLTLIISPITRALVPLSCRSDSLDRKSVV